MSVPDQQRLDAGPDAGADESRWPRFADVPEPRMVALFPGNGSGTKLYQSLLDGHPQVYMVPGYPLMYLYPHWHQWRQELSAGWSWGAIIDAFCVQHASVIDSRRIPGHDGLATLGENQDQFLAIDEDLFRAFLAHLLDGAPVEARTFLLAVHYTHAFCRGEDLAAKKALVYHIHVHEYVADYLVPDFPDMLVLATVRDPRSNIFGRYHHSEAAVDDAKLDKTDAIVYRRRTYLTLMRYFIDSLSVLDGVETERVRVIRHEDLYYKPDAVMRATAQFIGVDDDACLSELTFGGASWWGDKTYDMEPMNRANPRVVSLEWQGKLSKLEWFVLEGLFFDYMEKYGYEPTRYRKDGVLDRLLLLAALLAPSQMEREAFADYLRPSNLRAFLGACLDEATGAVALKDYGFNAYYRHKWSHKDLKLWRRRWFVRLLVAARERAAANPDAFLAGALERLAQAAYVAANLCRYGGSVAVYPVTIARRWRLSLRAFRRLVAKSNILPEVLS